MYCSAGRFQTVFLISNLCRGNENSLKHTSMYVAQTFAKPYSNSKIRVGSYTVEILDRLYTGSPLIQVICFRRCRQEVEVVVAGVAGVAGVDEVAWRPIQPVQPRARLLHLHHLLLPRLRACEEAGEAGVDGVDGVVESRP